MGISSRMQEQAYACIIKPAYASKIMHTQVLPKRPKKHKNRAETKTLILIAKHAQNIQENINTLNKQVITQTMQEKQIK